MHYDFEIRKICENSDGLLDFWNTFKEHTAKLFSDDGKAIITGFDENVEVKKFLLLYRNLIPKNFATRNFIPAVYNLIKVVMVN